MATSAINLLEDSAVDFKLLPNESCCGYILYTMGDVEAAKEVAQDNIQSAHLIRREPFKKRLRYSS